MASSTWAPTITTSMPWTPRAAHSFGASTRMVWCNPHLRWLTASSTPAQKAGYAYALDSKTGELLWRYSIGGGMQGVPVVENGVIYISSYSGFVYALEARPGE